MIICDECGEALDSGYDLDAHEYEHQQRTSRQLWSDKINRPKEEREALTGWLEAWPWWITEWHDELDVIRDELTVKEYAVLVEFARYCDGAGKTYVGMKAIAEKVGTSHTVANRAMEKAEGWGVVRNHGKLPGKRSYRRSVTLVYDELRQHEHEAMAGKVLDQWMDYGDPDRVTGIYDWIKRTGPNWWPSVDGDRDPIPVGVDLVALWGELPIEVEKCTGKGSRWCSDPERCTKAESSSD